MTLIDRLSKLEGPDREVDAELEAVSLGGRVYLNDPEGKEVIIERPIDGLWIRGIYPYRKISRYTTSVDAAIALAERVLRGWTGFLDFGGTAKTFVADIMSDERSKQTREDEEEFGIDPMQEAHGEGATPAIALCIAILRSKEASHGE